MKPFSTEVRSSLNCIQWSNLAYLLFNRWRQILFFGNRNPNPNPNSNPKSNPKPNPKPNPNLNPKPNRNPNPNHNGMFEISQFLRHPFETRNAYINISKLARDGGRVCIRPITHERATSTLLGYFTVYDWDRSQKLPVGDNSPHHLAYNRRIASCVCKLDNSEAPMELWGRV